MESASSTISTADHNLAIPILQRTRLIGFVGFSFLLLFTWLPNSYSYMVGWPYVLIWQGSFLVVGSYTIWLCRKFSIPFRRLGYGLDHVVILTITAAALSTTASEFRAVSCWNLLLIANYAVCLYFLTNFLRHKVITSTLLWGWLSIIGTVTNVIGLALWRPDPSMWLSSNFYSAIRNAQPLGHHNFVGGYGLLLLPIVCSFAIAQKSWRRWIGLLMVSIVVIAIYISGSRGALLGLLVLGAISIGAGILSSQGHYRRRWAAIGCCFALIMSLAMISNPRVRTLFSMDAPVEENTVSVASIPDGPIKDRLFMLSSTFNVLKERPILGVGPGTLSRVYNNFRPVEAGTGLNLVQQVHNTPAQLAAELGIAGITIYISFLAVLIRLCVSLRRRITKRSDRLLLYGIGGSWIGYGISSLSDYQLENIGITSTLIVTTALLCNLADTYRLHTYSFCLVNPIRRIISLFLLLLLCLNIQLWARVDIGLYLSHQAVEDAKASDLVGADRKLAKASQLVPWDPTYAALAAEISLGLSESAPSKKDVQALRLLALDYFRSTVRAAPNDPWFNQNLATLLIEQGKFEEAEAYINAAIRLLPRNTNNYTYYTLGLSLLKQNKNDEAVEAFALEAIANPIFMTTNVWEQPPLLSLKENVVGKTLIYYQQILSKTNQSSSQYQWLYEQLLMLAWWHSFPVVKQEDRDLSPIVEAVLVADDNSEKALSIVNQYISAGEYSSDLRLLQARLDPDRYLHELLSEIDSTPAEKAYLEESVRGNQTTKEWLNEARGPARKQTRSVSVYAYRNLAANTIKTILYPGDIEASVLLSSIGLFPDAPREYSQLDYFMSDLRSKKLSMR